MIAGCQCGDKFAVRRMCRQGSWLMIAHAGAGARDLMQCVRASSACSSRTERWARILLASKQNLTSARSATTLPRHWEAAERTPPTASSIVNLIDQRRRSFVENLISIYRRRARWQDKFAPEIGSYWAGGQLVSVTGTGLRRTKSG